MATPPRRAVLEDLATTLAAISTAAGYKTDVKTVKRLRSALVWEEVPAADRPYVGIVPMEERYTSEHVGAYYQVELDVDLVCYVAGTGADADARAVALSDAMNDLLDDIIAAVAVDRRRGGNATDTWVRNSFTDEGDTEADGCLRVGLTIRYHRTEAKS